MYTRIVRAYSHRTEYSPPIEEEVFGEDLSFGEEGEIDKELAIVFYI
jgi:hypothetical protein